MIIAVFSHLAAPDWKRLLLTKDILWWAFMLLHMILFLTSVYKGSRLINAGVWTYILLSIYSLVLSVCLV